MITEELKSTVDTLSADERHDLSAYLAEIELQNDPDYWEAIRRRTQHSAPSTWISTDEILPS